MPEMPDAAPQAESDAPAAGAPPRADRTPPLERYRRDRLAQPIALGFGFGFLAMLYIGAPALTLGSIAAAATLEGPGRGVGLFGAAFFGAAFLLLLAARRRARDGAAMRLDAEGLYFAHLDVVVPWARLGPAFVVETRVNQGTARQAVLLLREPQSLAAEADLFGRLLLALASRAAARARTPAGWGGETLALLHRADAPDLAAHLAPLEARLAALRARREAEGAAPLGAPLALHAGLTPDALVAILNAETLAREDVKIL